MKRDIIYSPYWKEHSKLDFTNLKYNKIWYVIDRLCIKSYLKRIKNVRRVNALLPLAKKVCGEMNTYLSYSFFRQVCALALILKYTKIHSALIIGDGYGFLSCLIKKVFPDSRIVLVDIPEILKIQKKYAKAEFYTPDQIDKIQGEFDLAINICSMQEMTKEMIALYFKLIRRTSKLFYCCNRLRKEYKGEIVRFHDYPWEKEIIYEEGEPDFYGYSYSWKPPFKRYIDRMWHRLIFIR